MQSNLRKVVYKDKVQHLRVVDFVTKSMFDVDPEAFTGPEGHTTPIEHLEVVQELGDCLLIAARLPSGSVRHIYSFLLRGADRQKVNGFWTFLAYCRQKSCKISTPRYLLA